MLDVELKEEVEALLEVDELEGVLACDVDGGLNEGNGCECAAKLVHLTRVSTLSPRIQMPSRLTQYISAQYHASTRNGNFWSNRLRK